MASDLHIHTTASDGRLSPQEVVQLAIKNNLKYIAITDHAVSYTHLGKKGVAITLIEPREYRQLKLIERLAKTKLVRKQLPSSADILERQREIIKTRLLKTLENNNFADYHTIVSDLTVDYDLIDVAAAALKLSVEGFKEKEDVYKRQLAETGIYGEGNRRHINPISCSDA